ncbi:hypothetical protein GBAR_LOCUS17937 [Geodia barretti]|uniref:Uncharacterized protein n=1 Tax=Geodia barretti TaxID=519541 RepID=A0AA35WYV7_GEOBA|nr:hypothetical protein GBAR_LOCUS17937 [Geodia barretti]
MKEDIMFKALQAKFNNTRNSSGAVGTKTGSGERSPTTAMGRWWGWFGEENDSEHVMRLRDDLTPKPETSHQSNNHNRHHSPTGQCILTEPLTFTQHQPLQKLIGPQSRKLTVLPRPRYGKQHKIEK